MVGVAFELFTELLHDFIYVLLCEVRGAQNNGLPVGKHGKKYHNADLLVSFNDTHCIVC